VNIGVQALVFLLLNKVEIFSIKYLLPSEYKNKGERHPPPNEFKNLKGFPRKAYGLIVKKTMLGCFNLLFTKLIVWVFTQL
jgi:hypothetical protein